jgi:hypothetical protein
MTHLRQFADHMLGGRLDAFVAEHRAQGIGWDKIARELWDCTEHKINLSGQTLRDWYVDREKRPA